MDSFVIIAAIVGYEHKLQQIDLQKERILGETNLKLREAANELRLSEKKSQEWDQKMLTIDRQTGLMISNAEQKAKDIQAFAEKESEKLM